MLSRDPYPHYARLQREAPIAWIESLGLWYVTRHADVRAILLDTANFTTASDHSLIFDTFGANVLTTEGAVHDRYRGTVQQAFAPGAIRRRFEAAIELASGQLIAGFAPRGQAELRGEFAARLPVLTMLSVFGMPAADETRMRGWYDAFEAALSNFTRDAGVRERAQAAVQEFHDYLRGVLEDAGAHGVPATSLLATLDAARDAGFLDDDEVRRNVSIILFGGISTVEALVLNALWALFEHPEVHRRAIADPALIAKVVEETLRWMSPVQSATRHVVRDVEFGGVRFRAGEVVNCMLGAANRDPSVFAEPHVFDVDRGNLHQHLAFAAGPHACLGFQLAKAEARIALRGLLATLPGLQCVRERSSAPEGYEFRQPRRLEASWAVA